MSVETLVALAQASLRAAAVPENVAPMQSYLKTDMPMYGVHKPQLRAVERALRAVPLPDAAAWRAAVGALWALPHREEKSLAIAVARRHPRHHDAGALDLFRQLVVEGAWWDLVDEIAVHLVGSAWLRDRARVAPVMDAWVDDPDVWVRRTAILGQLRHKERTDEARLFGYCRRRAGDREFWIRKAIGWALRQHGRLRPDAVRAFVDAERARLSGLSLREATRNLPEPA